MKVKQCFYIFAKVVNLQKTTLNPSLIGKNKIKQIYKLRDSCEVKHFYKIRDFVKLEILYNWRFF